MAKKKLTLEDVLVPKDEIPYEVPKNWCWVKLGGLTTVKSSKRILAKEYQESGIPFFRSKEVVRLSSNQDITDNIYITEERYNEIKDKFGVPKVGDLLITCVGTIGETWIVDDRKFYYKDGNLVQIDDNEYINTRYIELVIKSTYFTNWVNSTVSGSAYSALTIDKLKQLPIPFPPLAEQVRIVKRIESLFDKVDKAAGLVDEARDGFEKRRAAILERAFSGKLTKKWREENGVEFDEEKIALSEVVNVNPKKPKLEVDDDQICSFVPMAAVSDINGKIEVMEERLYSKVKKGYTYYEEGDVLFAKITPCMENGKSCIAVDLSNGFGFGTTEFHVLRCGEKVLNKYVYYLVRAKWFREEAKQHMTGAVGQQRVPKAYLEDYKVWVPSIEEQEEVVRLLEYMLDKEFEVEECCNIDDKIELLKKSILGRAFRGEIGSNDLYEESSLNIITTYK